MKHILAFVLAAFLHLHGAYGADPTYDELASQLPITLTPNGDDQYFFFIVPVQKREDQNVILQMAQAQSATNSTNSSVATTFIDTLNQVIKVNTSAAELNLDEAFSVPEQEPEPDFNFQVPVVVPLDFRFTYNPETTSTLLPECTVDSRTWKENVISRIAEKMDLDGVPSWDHSTLTLRIRLRKDGLASITLESISNTEHLDTFTSVLQQTKYLSDIRYYYIINDITELKWTHVSFLAEAVDTYTLLSNCITLAETSIAQFSGDPVNTVAVQTSEGRLNLIKDSVSDTLIKFTAALNYVKNLADEEEGQEMTI